MKRFVFVVVMTSLGVTVPGLAPAWPAPHASSASTASSREQKHAARVARIAQMSTATWTCSHNTYRSVACP